MSPALRIERGVARISQAMAWVSGGLVVVCSLLVVLDIVSRALAGRVVFESFEFSCYGFAAAFGLGLAHTAIERANVRVDIVNMMLGERLRLVLDVLAAIALAATALIFAWHASGTVLPSFGMGARSNSSLSIPLVYPQGLWAIGIVWFAVVAVLLAARSFVALLTGDRAKVERLVGLKATASADAERESI